VGPHWAVPLRTALQVYIVHCKSAHLQRADLAQVVQDWTVSLRSALQVYIVHCKSAHPGPNSSGSGPNSSLSEIVHCKFTVGIAMHCQPSVFARVKSLAESAPSSVI
jgi:hypothetical protein